jgi:hypothetical protein
VGRLSEKAIPEEKQEKEALGKLASYELFLVVWHSDVSDTSG